MSSGSPYANSSGLCLNMVPWASQDPRFEALRPGCDSVGIPDPRIPGLRPEDQGESQTFGLYLEQHHPAELAELFLSTASPPPLIPLGGCINV